MTTSAPGARPGEVARADRAPGRSARRPSPSGPCAWRRRPTRARAARTRPAGGRARSAGAAAGTWRRPAARRRSSVGTTIAAASISSASSTAACMIAAAGVSCTMPRARPWISGASSAASAIVAIARHGLDRVAPDARLGRQHHRRGAVDHRVGDVGDLGAGRLGRLDHRLEHLRRRDHELALAGGAGDRVLLHQRHARDARLHAVVAARDHHAVGRPRGSRRGPRRPRPSRSWRSRGR